MSRLLPVVTLAYRMANIVISLSHVVGNSNSLCLEVFNIVIYTLGKLFSLPIAFTVLIEL